MNGITARLTGHGSPFELVQTIVDGLPCPTFIRGPQSLNEIYRNLSLSRESEYVVTPSARLTRKDVSLRARALASSLQRMFGLGVGSRCAIIMENCPEWVVAFVAITSIGATVVAIHPSSRPADVESALQCSHCKVIVCDREHAAFLDTVSTTRHLVVYRGDDDTPLQCHWIDLQTLTAHSNTLLSPIAINPETIALIAYTSGSTGNPKGVIVSHRNLVTGLMNMLLAAALSVSRSRIRGSAPPSATNGLPCVLVVSALSHISGYSQLLLMLHLGGKLVLTTNWALPEVMQLIAREQVRSIIGATPAMLREIAAYSRKETGIGCLTSFHLHGSALQTQLLKDLMIGFPRSTICTGYGLTETSGAICGATTDELLDRPGTSGQILPSVMLKCIDSHGLVAPVGSIGEILVRGAMTMRGYCGMPQETAAIFTDGWLRTGDIGRVDADGFLYVVGRFQDLINVEGRSVFSSALEQAALRSDVSEAAVLGVMTLSSAEELLVAVIPRISGGFSIDSLEKHIATQIDVSGFRLRIIVCGVFPRTASGKIDRALLRRQLASTMQQPRG